MTKLIRTWEELGALCTPQYEIKVGSCGADVVEISTGNFIEYLSSHTFYDKTYNDYTRILRGLGFDVQIENHMGETEWLSDPVKIPEDKRKRRVAVIGGGSSVSYVQQMLAAASMLAPGDENSQRAILTNGQSYTEFGDFLQTLTQENSKDWKHASSKAKDCQCSLPVFVKCKSCGFKVVTTDMVGEICNDCYEWDKERMKNNV